MKKLWYAVNRSGQGQIFTSCPTRNDAFKIWEGNIEGCILSAISQMEMDGDITLPDITWKDEPVELILEIRWGGQGST